jgi:lysozyme
MNYSSNLVALVKKYENCSLTAYPDADGFSIGYGHYGATEGEQITQDIADSLLEIDLTFAASTVNKYVTRVLTQGQFDALCDFVYNLGVGTFHRSKLLYYVNQSMDTWAESNIMLYVYAGGHLSSDLVNRRTEEKELYEGKI